MSVRSIVLQARFLAYQYPDFVYDGAGKTCYNNQGGDPKYPQLCGCIVGQACRAAGYDPPNTGSAFTTLLDLGLYETRNPPAHWLGEAQVAQDQGKPWSWAVAKADTEHPLKPTLDDIVEAVRFLASQYPDFVYQRPRDSVACWNDRGGDPRYPEACGCIVGQALKLLGVDLSPLSQASSSAWLERLGLDHYGHPAHWLAQVQGSQDMGTPWQEAVQQADSVVYETE